MNHFRHARGLNGVLGAFGILVAGGLSQSGQAAIDRDTLATLAAGCSPGQRAEWNGTAWTCKHGARAPLTLDGEGTLLEVTSRVEPSLGKYAMTTIDHSFESPFPYVDKTLQLGYNYKHGIRNDPQEAAVFLQFESKYQLNNSGEADQKVTETHLSGVDLSGIEHRHYSSAMAWNGSFGKTTISATTLDLLDWDETLLGKLTAGGLVMAVPLSSRTDTSVKFQVMNAASTVTNLQIADSGNSLRFPLTIDGRSEDALNVVNSSGGPTRISIKSGATSDIATQLIQQDAASGTFDIMTGVPAAAIRMFPSAGGFLVYTPAFGAALEVTNAGETRALGGLTVSGKLYSGSTSGPTWTSGAGTPEGVVEAPVGSLYSRTDGGVGSTLYVKESGTGNTGWVAK